MSRIVGRELRGYGGALTAGICGDMVYSLLHALKWAYQYGIRIGRVIRHYWQERGKRRHIPRASIQCNGLGGEKEKNDVGSGYAGAAWRQAAARDS